MNIFFRPKVLTIKEHSLQLIHLHLLYPFKIISETSPLPSKGHQYFYF